MTPRHLTKYADPALSVPPASPALALLALAIGCLLIASTIWIGRLVRPLMVSAQMSAQPPALHVVDAERALIFDADTATGDVRVLNVRSGVTEIARLHEQQRQSVSAISLDADKLVLTVDSDTGRYEYDTRSFRLLTRNPIIAAGPDT